MVNGDVLDSKLCNRPWVYMDSGRTLHNSSSDSTEQQNGFQFTIATYNVLAQNLLEDNSYLYSHCENSHYLEWSYRQQQLLAEITYYQPDVSWMSDLWLCFMIIQALFRPVTSQFINSW